MFRKRRLAVIRTLANCAFRIAQLHLLTRAECELCSPSRAKRLKSGLRNAGPTEPK